MAKTNNKSMALMIKSADLGKSPMMMLNPTTSSINGMVMARILIVNTGKIEYPYKI